jgi:DNA-binding CsgD family transcriptional regulator
VSRLLALVDGAGPDRDDVDGWVTSRQLAAAPAPEALQAAVSRSAAGAEVAHPALDRLTSREREVLAELAAGRSYHELSGALGISLHTVRTHVRNLLGKLDLTTRLEAVTLARRAGLVAAREAGE